MLVPSLSQSNLMADLIKGETVEPLHVLASTISTAIYASALAWLAIKLYRRERILG